MTMQDNGICPNERPSLISSTPISGTMDCQAQDTKKVSRGLTGAAKTADRAGATKKTAHIERGNAKGCQGGMKSPKPKSHGAERPEGMPKLCVIEI